MSIGSVCYWISCASCCSPSVPAPRPLPLLPRPLSHPLLAATTQNLKLNHSLSHSPSPSPNPNHNPSLTSNIPHWWIREGPLRRQARTPHPVSPHRPPTSRRPSPSYQRQCGMSSPSRSQAPHPPRPFIQPRPCPWPARLHRCPPAPHLCRRRLRQTRPPPRRQIAHLSRPPDHQSPPRVQSPSGPSAISRWTSSPRRCWMRSCGSSAVMPTAPSRTRCASIPLCWAAVVRRSEFVYFLYFSLA